MSCGVGCRHGLDPALLRLWRRPVATALIQPLAWEPPYAKGVAQEMAKRQKKKRKKKNNVLVVRKVKRTIKKSGILKKSILYNSGCAML